MKLWLLLIALVLLSSCGQAAGPRTFPARVAPGVQQIGFISHPEIREDSGIVASRRHTNVFWTHNDGGRNRQALYAMERSGKVLARFAVTGAVMDDWEDIAIDDDGNIYLADTGDNDLQRRFVAVCQVKEPDPVVASGNASVTRSWLLRFPEGATDCEGLFVFQGHGYLISKTRKKENARIFRFALTQAEAEAGNLTELEFVAEAKIDSPVAGADISADGLNLGIVAEAGAFVYRIDGDVSRVRSLKPKRTKFKHTRMEGCTFVPDGLLATAESREVFLFIDPAFHPATK